MSGIRSGGWGAVWTLLAVVALAEVSGRAKPEPKLLTQEECRQLVLAVLKDEGVNMEDPTLELESLPYEKSPPDFYNIDTHDLDFNGNYPSLGSYSVDRRTGDVWSYLICLEYASKSVVKLQRKIRKRLGITPAKYRKLRRPGPPCLGKWPSVSGGHH